MYCNNCGKQTPLHSAFCLHCVRPVAIQQAIPLRPTGRKTRMILSVLALGLTCFVALLFGFSRDTGQRQSAALLTRSGPTATPLEFSTPAIAATPAAERRSKTSSKTDASVMSLSGASSLRLDSTAVSALSASGESAFLVRNLSPKCKWEETFYIARTGARYHGADCRHLRYSAYSATRAEAEAQGYTPYQVCYP